MAPYWDREYYDKIDDNDDNNRRMEWSEAADSYVVKTTVSRENLI